MTTTIVAVVKDYVWMCRWEFFFFLQELNLFDDRARAYYRPGDRLGVD